MKTRLGALIVATIALGVASSDGDAQERAPRALNFARDCVAPLGRGDPFANSENRLSEIANACRDISNTARGVGAARARFYAGRAYRMMGSRPGGSREDLNEAVRHLEAAVSIGPDFSAVDFGAEQRAATIELVQAYRLRQDYREARERLNRTGPGALSPDDGAVAYQRAMLILADEGANTQTGKEGAFGALRPVFTRSTLSLNPPLTEAERRNGPSNQSRLSASEIRNGRALLFSLGSELGRDALEAQSGARDRAQSVIQGTRAIEYLTAAAAVVRESEWNIGAPEGGRAPNIDDMSDVFFKLGNARLRAAGVAPRTNGPDLDCLVGERARSGDFASQIRDAREAFDTVLANPGITGARREDAHWGLGCAALAGLEPRRGFDGDLQTAIRDLRLAVGQTADGAPTGGTSRPEYLLTLASAEFIQDAGQAARNSYNAALRALPGSEYAALRSEIYVNIARTHLFSRCRPGDNEPRRGCISFRNPNPIDLSGVRTPNSEAQRALSDALAADPSNSDARLMLTQIHMQRREWGPARTQLNALLAGNTALEEDDPRKSFARYLSSRRETWIRQACLAANNNARSCGNSGNGTVAFNDASRASMSDQTSPEYRLQTCIAIILFGREQDERYCIANSPDAEALLLEGMYWLRRSHGARQGTVQDRWGQSLGAFERGSRLASSESATIYPEGFPPESSIPLSDLLRYGERYVRLCAIGRAGDTESATQQVKDYFHQSGMLPCLVRS